MNQIKSVLIVDDHPIIVVAMKSLIESRMPKWQLMSAASRADALRACDESAPSLAIIDLMLPDGNGMDLIREILRKAPECKVLVFSMQCELRYGPRVFREGAKGYLMKGEKISRLFDAIQHIEDGKTYCSENLREVMMQHWTQRPNVVSTCDSLSTREFQIFRMLGQGQTSKEIGSSLSISPKTVESHRENMKKKLSCNTSNELVLRARDWLHLDEGDAAVL